MFCRRAVKEDIDDIRDIAIQSWHDTYEGLIPREAQDKYLEKAYSKERLQERIDKNHMFVCEKAGRVIGFASFFYETAESAEIGAIYVLPGAQREGVGSALMRHLWSHMQNVRELYIDIESGNDKAENFYLLSGFEYQTEFEEDFEGYRLKTKRLRMKAEDEKLHRL